MEWLFQLAALFLSMFGSFALVIAPVLVWVAGRDDGQGDAPGFRMTLVIFWGLALAGALMVWAGVYIGGQVEWPD